MFSSQPNLVMHISLGCWSHTLLSKTRSRHEQMSLPHQIVVRFVSCIGFVVVLTSTTSLGCLWFDPPFKLPICICWHHCYLVELGALSIGSGIPRIICLLCIAVMDSVLDSGSIHCNGKRLRIWRSKAGCLWLYSGLFPSITGGIPGIRSECLGMLN